MTDSDAPIIEALHVSKSFGGIPALIDVSLAVDPGDILVVQGANGTGKSTLLRCLAGWDRFDSGDVFFGGTRCDARSADFRAAVACSLDFGDQFLNLTVREHLEFLARAHGNDQPDATVSAVLAELALTRVADRFPFALSQGQRRRLGLAACFVRPRRLLILDEPEQNLDVHGRTWLAAKLLAERARGVAVIVACHDRELADEIADLTLDLALDEDEPGSDGPGSDIVGPDVEAAAEDQP